jgi:hypothetical protein
MRGQPPIANVSIIRISRDGDHSLEAGNRPDFVWKIYAMAQLKEPDHPYISPVDYTLRTLLVAENFSSASDSALKYAVMFAKRFGSHIHLIRVQTPTDFAEALEGGSYAMKISEDNTRTSLGRVNTSAIYLRYSLGRWRSRKSSMRGSRIVCRCSAAM